MKEEVIISGFGGQGALFAGQLLAHAALSEGRYVTWIPSYGPEMRGGTAHCTVVVADAPIASPLVRRPSSLVALNLPSFRRYEAEVRPGGFLVYNSSLFSIDPGRSDLVYVAVPGTAIATELGSARQANVVLLAALATATGMLSVASLEEALVRRLPEHNRKLLQGNQEALRRGALFGDRIKAQ